MKQIFEYLLSKSKNKQIGLFHLDMSYKEAVDIFKGYDKKVFDNIVKMLGDDPKDNELFCLEKDTRGYDNVISFRQKTITYSITFNKNKGITYINKYIATEDHKNDESYSATYDAKEIMQEFLDELNDNFEL